MLLDPSKEVKKVYNTRNLTITPKDSLFQSIEWAVVKDGVLYFSECISTAPDKDSQGDYLVAVDINTDKTLWMSKPRTVNSSNFLIVDNSIICGLGGSGIPDYIYVLNRYTGANALGDNLRLGGSIVGKIESNGDVRIGGSIVGRFEANGDIRVGGSIVGRIEKNGDIRKNGSIIGRVEQNNDVRISGSIVGRVEKNGDIRKNGSIIGRAEQMTDVRRVAVMYFFPFFNLR